MERQTGRMTIGEVNIDGDVGDLLALEQALYETFSDRSSKGIVTLYADSTEASTVITQIRDTTPIVLTVELSLARIIEIRTSGSYRTTVREFIDMANNGILIFPFTTENADFYTEQSRYFGSDLTPNFYFRIGGN